MPAVTGRRLEDADATLQLGRELAAVLRHEYRGNACIYLVGELGAGKTTLCRGIVQALGHAGPVKSPTYTLLEPYELGDTIVLHADLYRLAFPGELVGAGLDEALDTGCIRLIEWPDRGEGYLPAPDLTITLHLAGEARTVDIDVHNTRA
ncbi:MAG: tRNA (adenosine(37)-N6)-threonylcarbamoyltransferase complex ATPase subunit type 1 TsaE [Pseudomonadales bacterium]|nr:tRNA (adenosine(37)-N6)-threonylcarbamoyltransferase complex ATPase subunit type 1 TsaE [Pseudomonadales bacterium]